MVDLKIFIAELCKQTQTKKSINDINSFLKDNDWFGLKPSKTSTGWVLTEEQIQIYTEPLIHFMKADATENPDKMFFLFKNRWPTTADHWNSFCKDVNLSDMEKFYVMDFMMYYLTKEIPFYLDKEMESLVQKAIENLNKKHGDVFTFFLSWVRTKVRTHYHKDYVLSQRFSMELKKQAYDFDEYLELLYYLYNDSYITDNCMYERAAQSKNFADTWLFLSIHLICALRTTDLLRIPHPTLPYKPEQILLDIGKGIFSDKDARTVIQSVIYRLCLLPLTPNKTASHSGITSVKFTVPESCEIHIGKLFALCEAHRQVQNIPDGIPLIRKISDYERINRYMGDEIGDLFLESNFRTRSANKSYLQSIFMLADDILGDGGEIRETHMRGYMLAALARSHKGSYGEYAKTTQVYLKDAKFHGLSPEFVARELFERGVLSFIPSMLLNMITNGEYSKISATNQTKLIQALNLTPNEVENLVSITEKGKEQAQEAIKEISNYSQDEKTILDILHQIASGNAVSKNPENLCLISALRKTCPYTEQKICLGCKYEISTKSTFYLMISELNRTNYLSDNVIGAIEKKKYHYIINEILLPRFDELLGCLREIYGEKVFHDYEEILKENVIQ